MRAHKLLRFFESLYRCTNCGYTEASEDINPSEMMKGVEGRCSRCGEVSQAFWGHKDLPGEMVNPKNE